MRNGKTLAEKTLMARIAIVVSSPLAAKVFMRDHIRALSEIHEVTVFSNMQNPCELAGVWNRVHLQKMQIEREIALFRDFLTLWRIWRALRRGHFDVVHSVTPKAGLMAMVGGLLAGVPHRIHTFTGQVWATRRGFSRWLLKNIDRIIAFAASRILVDSPSQRVFLLAEHVICDNKSSVLCDGSIAGVNLQRFRPNPEARRAVRQTLGIDDAIPLLLFIGRLKSDKGVVDLLRAYISLEAASVHSTLLIVGPDEEGLRDFMEKLVQTHRNTLWFIPHTDEPERYMAAADVLCLPSSREGFGNVIIEAAACGVPAVATRIYGIIDAVEDRRTGLLYDPGNIGDLRKHLQRLIEDREYRIRMGQAAHERVVRIFPQERLTSALLALYEDLLN